MSATNRSSDGISVSVHVCGGLAQVLVDGKPIFISVEPFDREGIVPAVDAIHLLNSLKVAVTDFIVMQRAGEIGDSFVIRSPNNVYNQRFNIIDIWYRPLWRIREAYYRLEGFNSPEEFQETWKALHRGHFSAEKHYYIHFFARCPDD